MAPAERILVIKQLLEYNDSQLAMQFRVSRETIHAWMCGQEPHPDQVAAIGNLELHAQRLVAAGAVRPMWELNDVSGLETPFIEISAMDLSLIEKATNFLIAEAEIIARARAELDALFDPD